VNDGGADADADGRFGFEHLSPESKTARVRAVFDSVAHRYDLMNDLMSGGLHRLWKRIAVELLDLRGCRDVLDLASGTGDLARLIRRRSGGRARVVACDINAGMLTRGRDRSIDAGLIEGLAYVQADAEALPFPNACMDRVIMGFGLRNVTRKTRALAEIHRVLRPGGFALILEFSRVKSPALAWLYDLYSFRALPLLGRLVAGDADSYRYLAESIRVHPDEAALALMLERAGFERVRCHTLMTGIVALHRGWKL
jgi:demethylmenaquinone methyltransferase/2-methoxy-6-polyprenyl-1,4-benzoquinol methylase